MIRANFFVKPLTFQALLLQISSKLEQRDTLSLLSIQHLFSLVIGSCSLPILLFLNLRLNFLQTGLRSYVLLLTELRFSKQRKLRFGFPTLIRNSNVFIRILKQSFDESQISSLNLLINTRLILLRNRGNYIRNAVSILFHFLVMGATLAGIASDNHIAHHFIDARILLFFRVLQQFSKKRHKNCVLESLLLIPVAVSLVFAKSAEGSLDDAEGQSLLYLILSKDARLMRQSDLTLHSLCLYYQNFRMGY